MGSFGEKKFFSPNVQTALIDLDRGRKLKRLSKYEFSRKVVVVEHYSYLTIFIFL